MRELSTSIGDDINDCIQKAIKSARKDEYCMFIFNGVCIIAAHDSNPDLIYRDWSRCLSGYLHKNKIVGPYPIEKLSVAELESDAKIQAKKDKASQERQKKWDQETRLKRVELGKLIVNDNPFECSDTEKWQQCKDVNKDPYSARCVSYAEEWARAMQAKIREGQTVAKCAEPMSRLADYDGITGFMYGAAVSMLAQYWKHGEELRRWHNKDTQIGTEGDAANESGGVLNPALLTIEGRK